MKSKPAPQFQAIKFHACVWTELLRGSWVGEFANLAFHDPNKFQVNSGTQNKEKGWIFLPEICLEQQKARERDEFANLAGAESVKISLHLAASETENSLFLEFFRANSNPARF